MNRENHKSSKKIVYICALLLASAVGATFIFSIIGVLNTFDAHPVLGSVAFLLVIPWNMAIVYLTYDEIRKKCKPVNEGRSNDHDG